MANQAIVINIPDVITSTTPVIIKQKLIITHPENEEECYILSANSIELNKDECLEIQAVGADFEITLEEGIFDRSGKITIKKDNFVLLQSEREKYSLEIPIICGTCLEPYINIDGPKKLIVKSVGEFDRRRLMELFNKIDLFKKKVLRKNHN